MELLIAAAVEASVILGIGVAWWRAKGREKALARLNEGLRAGMAVVANQAGHGSGRERLRVRLEQAQARRQERLARNG